MVSSQKIGYDDPHSRYWPRKQKLKRVASGFGRRIDLHKAFHYGVDFSAPKGHQFILLVVPFQKLKEAEEDLAITSLLIRYGYKSLYAHDEIPFEKVKNQARRHHWLRW